MLRKRSHSGFSSARCLGPLLRLAPLDFQWQRQYVRPSVANNLRLNENLHDLSKILLEKLGDLRNRELMINKQVANSERSLAPGIEGGRICWKLKVSLQDAEPFPIVMVHGFVTS